jgi:hypothetical protein
MTLRNQGRTWAEIAAAVGLSHSRVRTIYATCSGTVARPPLDDSALLENLCAFVAEQGAKSLSRRAYMGWPGRVVSHTTMENRFGSWQRALERAGVPKREGNSRRGNSCEPAGI